MTRSDSQSQECVMREGALFWGLLLASLTNALCLYAYFGG